ncbi:hypothetical protein [Clostridium tagluense]|uniref:hypothetical protein n=1 Tax=Clostridium tagluense TaxID=360422 RepID=UPI001C6F3F1D|nr:hypothetical protein [Clostridium tagluense]MBW9159451.1 hypothetical protein [Clostridium tagluense]WLC68458.1 hypothetical protein KTC93_26005 [Clostridium tagluense]
MNKKMIITLLCIFMTITLVACTVKKNNKVEDPVVASITQIKSYEAVYNWSISSDKNNPEQIKKVLKILYDVDFKKLYELEQSKGKEIQFYEPFYNYPNHNFETIQNIFDAKTDGAISADFSYLIFNLYKKSNVKPIIEKVVSSNPKYKEKLDSIIKFESQ